MVEGVLNDSGDRDSNGHDHRGLRLAMSNHPANHLAIRLVPANLPANHLHPANLLANRRGCGYGLGLDNGVVLGQWNFRHRRHWDIGSEPESRWGALWF